MIIITWPIMWMLKLVTDIILLLFTLPFINEFTTIIGLQALLGIETRKELVVKIKHKRMRSGKIKSYYPDGLLGMPDRWFAMRKLKTGWTFYTETDQKNAFMSNMTMRPEYQVFQIPIEAFEKLMDRRDFRGREWNEKKARKDSKKEFSKLSDDELKALTIIEIKKHAKKIGIVFSNDHSKIEIINKIRSWQYANLSRKERKAYGDFRNLEI